MLTLMGLQRVGHNLATEQQQQYNLKLESIFSNFATALPTKFL